jgi:hypothetical protein
MMHGDMKHSAWKPDTGEEASEGEWSSPNHPRRGSVHGGDFLQFEAEAFEAESEAESFASTECPAIRLQCRERERERERETGHRSCARRCLHCARCESGMIWRRLEHVMAPIEGHRAHTCAPRSNVTDPHMQP